MNRFTLQISFLDEGCFPFEVAKEYLKTMQISNQLPEGCDWDEGGAMMICESTGSGLWSAIWARTDVATASALEVELTPLEVLTELC